MNESSQVLFENLACDIKEMLSCRSIDVSQFKNTQILKKKHEMLACDDECLLAERNKNLATALQIDTSIRAKPIYSDLLKNYAREEPAFITDLEKRLELIIKECKLMTKPIKKWFNLPIMKSFERKIIHELAAYYGLETQSVDPEPYRQVCVIALKDKCFLPQITLSQSCDFKVAKQHSSMPRLKLSQMTSASNSILQSNLKKLNNFNSFEQQQQQQQPIQVSTCYSVLADNNDSDEEDEDKSLFKRDPTKNEKVIDYFDLTD
jgi:transcriptional repressor NF-X1